MYTTTCVLNGVNKNKIERERNGGERKKNVLTCSDYYLTAARAREFTAPEERGISHRIFAVVISAKKRCTRAVDGRFPSASRKLCFCCSRTFSRVLIIIFQPTCGRDVYSGVVRRSEDVRKIVKNAHLWEGTRYKI